MDQASASPVASCAHNPAAPRTLPSWLPSEGQARTVVPSRDGSAPQSVPHSEPVHIVPRPSSPALCQSDAKGYLLPDYYSGATGIPGRFSEGLLLRRLQIVSCDTQLFSSPGCDLLSQPAICSGDQFNLSFLATARRRHGLVANLYRFGRRDRAQACSSAGAAR